MVTVLVVKSKAVLLFIFLYSCAVLLLHTINYIHCIQSYGDYWAKQTKIVVYFNIYSSSTASRTQNYLFVIYNIPKIFWIPAIKTQSTTVGAESMISGSDLSKETKTGYLLFYLLQPWQARFFSVDPDYFWHSVG